LIACELDRINILSAADNRFILSSSFKVITSGRFAVSMAMTAFIDLIIIVFSQNV